MRERASTAREFDPAEIDRSEAAPSGPPILLAVLPIGIVVAVNLLMSFVILPRMDVAFLAEPQWGSTNIAAVGGLWSVIVALFAAVIAVIAINFRSVPELRATMTSDVNASVLPIISVASLVGFGAVVASLPAFADVREWVLSIGGGAAGVAGGGHRDPRCAHRLGLGRSDHRSRRAWPDLHEAGAEDRHGSALMHRVAVIGSGTLDSLPHNGAVVTLLSVRGVTHKEGYLDIVMTAIVSALIALVAVIVLGSLLGNF